MRILTLAATALFVACGGNTGAKLATAEDSVSYVIGYQIGTNLKQQGAPARPRALLRGLTEGFDGTTALLSDSLARATVMAYQQRAADNMAATNVTDAQKFFTENRTQPGVQETASGLQWKVLREGKGARPKPTSVARVNYRGTLLTGEEFDANDGVEIPLNQVIPGWTEGLQLMSSGAKYQFWIPAALAYGPEGSPPAIGPHAALIFEVELVSFR